MGTTGMEQQTKNQIKKIGGIALNVVLWAFVIFAVIVTIIAVSAGTNAKNVPAVGGKCYLSVWSGSMDAKKPEWAKDKPDGFKVGDLIISDYIYGSDKVNSLSRGDVITFEFDRNNNGLIDPGEYNTHRIIDIEYYGESDGANAGKIKCFITQGDNNLVATETVFVGQVIAVYTGKKIGLIGNMFDFLNKPLGFGLCILLPLVLFFAYELFVFVKTYISVKNEGKKLITADDEELIKQRAIEEYLKSQQSNQNNQTDQNNQTNQNSSGDNDK